MQDEQERRKSQYIQIFEMLKQHGQATNRQLSVISFRYSARIQELRKDGHKISTHQVRPGLFTYVYHGHKDDELEQASLFTELLNDADA